MKIIHDAWKCEFCRHIWLAFDNDPPVQCAKCRKRGWNSWSPAATSAKPPISTETSDNTVNAPEPVSTLIDATVGEDDFVEPVVIYDEDLPLELD